MHKHLLAFLILSMAVVSTLWAQPLAEHVPADAVVYVGWRGADDLGEGYAGSNLQSLREATELPGALLQTLDLIEQANAGNEDVARITALIRTIGTASWRRPTAAYLQPTDNLDMPVRLVVLWRVQGVQAEQLEAQLKQTFPAVADALGPQLTIRRTDELVSLTIGDPDADENDIAAVGASLADNPAFKRTLAQVNPGGVLVIYADGRGLISLIDLAIQMEGGPQEMQMWPKIRNALGLEGLNSAAWSAGFDGKDWRTDVFVDAPAPRTGLLAMLDGGPITDAELEAVPAEATWMLATRFDLGALLDAIREGVDAVNPEMSPMLEGALAQANAMTGVDIEADLIRSLGSAWFVYTDPGATGSGMMGFCLVNPLNDAEKTQRALTSLQTIANALMGQIGGGSGGGSGGNAGGNSGGPKMHIRFRTTTDRGMTLHSLGVPFVAPTWSVYDGRLYVGLYPQTVLNAGDRARADGGSILDNEKYQALRARLGGGEANSIVFADLPRTAQDAYPNLVMMSQMGSGMLAMFGSDTMPMLLPPFSRIEPYLAPAGQVSWSDDTGYHARALSPFPGAMMLGPQGGTNATMSAPMMVGILLPALGAARRSARQMTSMSNLRQLEMSAIAYAADNRSSLPEDIYELKIYNAELTPRGQDPAATFISPAIDIAVPRDYARWSKQEQSQWLRENSSYILIPTKDIFQDENAGQTVNLFERPDHASTDKIAVGFNDGHVEMVEIYEAREMIEAQTGKTLEELIERQRNYQSPVAEPPAPSGAPAAP